MTYMEKKTSKRQTAIVTLSDQNQKEIEDIKKQKEEMLADYEKKKQGVYTARVPDSGTEQRRRNRYVVHSRSEVM